MNPTDTHLIWLALAAVQQFTRQHPGLDIVGYDGVSDNAQEIFNFC